MSGIKKPDATGENGNGHDEEEASLIEAAAAAVHGNSRMVGDLSRVALGALVTWLGSETPDNARCAKRIEFGLVDLPRPGVGRVMGLKLRNRDILLSDVLLALEDAPIPRSVRAALPSLRRSDWDAVMRFLTLLLLAAEVRPPKPKPPAAAPRTIRRVTTFRAQSVKVAPRSHRS